MNAVILLMIVVFVALQGVLKKAFNEKVTGGAYFFSALSTVAAMLFFVVTSGNMEFNPDFLPYSLGFGISYAMSLIFGVLAIYHGSLSLTTLITSYSLMIPTLYGLIFLPESASNWLYIGIALLAVSLILVNKTSKNNPISFKWVVYVFLSFLGNGMCSVVQNMQQKAFDGAYKNEFMIAALIFVVIVSGILTIAKERKTFTVYLKKGWILAILCGIMNGVANLFVMILSNKMPASVMFPTISAGGIVITYIISKLLYKETLTNKQLIGFAIGTLSVIFLSI